MMNIALIEDKIRTYQCKNAQEEWTALREVTQEITLLALSKAKFFSNVAFCGGTCLRILYNLPRFSEDLDFVLKSPTDSFSWNNFMSSIKTEFTAFGFDVNLKDKNSLDSNVKKMFLKDNSLGGLLVFSHLKKTKNVKKISVKLEIDVNPPANAMYESKILDFPLPYEITTLDLPSNFAGKIHALLSRTYTKGRDWFDFIWYTTRQTPVNFNRLQSALYQAGPWSNQNLIIDKNWLTIALTNKINAIDWQQAKQDIQRFLTPALQESLNLWSANYFLEKLQQLQ